MNNPPPQSAPYSDAPDDSRSISEAGSTCSWGSEASSEDSDEGEIDSLADEGCADKAYWEEDTAADAWLARFPGGTSVLYPQLFVVKPRGGKVLTQSRYPSNVSLLHLPSEIRNRIYRHYFDRDEEVKRPEERYAPFLDRDGIDMQRICLSSEVVELKFWLSTALLQTSRQLRFEAMFIFFSNRVITVEWLPVLPRFVEFLGKEGCAMVCYLDIWDTLDLQGDDNAGYRDIITSLMHFSGLQHLRIVVSWGGIRHPGLWSDRTYSWFDQNEWKPDGTLTKQAVPKMRSEDIESHWPEYEILKNLNAQKLTFAVNPPWADEYLEFDRSHGAYPGISKSMQSRAARTQSAPSSANLVTSSISPQVLEAFEAIETQPRSSALTPNTEFDDEDPDSPTWQETDTLANKSIPLYNFLRELFHNNLPLWPVRGEMSVDRFVAFPTARKSTGSIMQDCAFCYLSERHCGHHAVPDQPPFEPTGLEGDDEKEDVKTLQRRFEDLSYVDMREVCRDVVQWMKDIDNFVHARLPYVTEFLNIAAIFDYLGWPETPNSERLARLDAAVEAGWTGKRVDKDEVPPWDMLYREVHSLYSYHYSFRGEARSS
ncbi:uncharacterized protein PAC_06325 [Phialocephala subalpina]|uniref:Uncharacterized protein n=1 Tax=Phialocephala subalpina TaxID=576137 RepID=A0A1L7WUI2_9HELO|nr:uncharacterized protein PAC_06325 [Phialocephala subalpina]